MHSIVKKDLVTQLYKYWWKGINKRRWTFQAWGSKESDIKNKEKKVGKGQLRKKMMNSISDRFRYRETTGPHGNM